MEMETENYIVRTRYILTYTQNRSENWANDKILNLWKMIKFSFAFFSLNQMQCTQGKITVRESTNE